MLVVIKSTLPKSNKYVENTEPGRPYLVLAIENRADSEHGQEWFYVYNDAVMSNPYARPAEIFDVVDEQKPHDWETAKRDDVTLKSFSEWVKDSHFYNYLLENQWQPNKTIWAHDLIREKYQQYVHDFAVKKFGSVEAFRNRLAEKTYDEALRNAKNKGYESPDRKQIEVEASSIHLNLDDLYQTTIS